MTATDLWMILTARGFDLPVDLCWVLAMFISDGDTTFLDPMGAAHGDMDRIAHVDWIPLCGAYFGDDLVSPDVEAMMRRYVHQALGTEHLHSEYRKHMSTPAVQAWMERTS